MTGPRKAYTLLTVAAIGVAVLAWRMGVDKANAVVGLAGVFAASALGLLSLFSAIDPRLSRAATDAAALPPGSTPAAPDAPAGSTAPPAGPGPRRRWWLPAGIAALLLVIVGTVAVLSWPTDRTPDARGASPATSVDAASAGPTGAATPGGSTPTVDPSGATPTATPATPDPGPDGPTTGPAPTPTPGPTPTRGPVGPDWVPPAGAPHWTLLAEDSVYFLPRPRVARGTGAGTLIFQAQHHQLALYDWTDDPTDLSYEGCRNPKAQRYPSIDLEQLEPTPVTYCQPDPGDPTVVNYVRIDHNRYLGTPASVDVTVWSVRS
ncbi:hypothetical protein [Micromonospora sp. HUAS LYJ1]|uniref:hypothetical protein n=1 Tax=Micromonospora sp. HUAS LYJ1 TaxID=3061626 RepID=UPI0026722EBC|nr:hypothetical protein [Micromonospora sp. HUAS LYJ1]WKU02717.1 hypothetical protein Q2K16_17525 [Micromonospora sp. HUAS LYJ1]